MNSGYDDTSTISQFAPHSNEFFPPSNPPPMCTQKPRCLSQRFAHGLAHAAHGDDGVDVRRVLARERCEYGDV
jgi:hypothetical protein